MGQSGVTTGCIQHTIVSLHLVIIDLRFLMSKASLQEKAGLELEALIATGDRIIAIAEESGDRIEGSAITDLMAWASGSGHIIRELTGKGSAYDVTFQRARDTQA